MRLSYLMYDGFGWPSPLLCKVLGCTLLRAVTEGPLCLMDLDVRIYAAGGPCTFPGHLSSSASACLVCVRVSGRGPVGSLGSWV